jgi:hypothetical protein
LVGEVGYFYKNSKQIIMKKILFVCDGDNFPKGAFQFIRQLSMNERVSVKGIFFNPIDYEEMIALSHMRLAEPFVKFEEDEKRLVMKSKEQFANQCENSRIQYHILEKSQGWDKEIFKNESRFADLAVISEELFCSDLFSPQPNFFMQEALRGAECPVLVIPEKFEMPDRVAIAYDGKPESMFALKQFTYLLPQFTDLPTDFIYVKNEGSEEIPNSDLLREYSRLHFASMGTSKLHFDAKKYFASWLEDKKNVMLVTGSFARSSVSNLFNRSFADKVIHDHTSPVFIAHHV